MQKRMRGIMLMLVFACAVSFVFGTGKADAKKRGASTSIQVLNSKVVRVKLAKAGKVSAKKVKIAVKQDKKGRYNKSVAVGSVVKVSKKVYDVILKTNDTGDYDPNTFSTGDVVKVKIGNKTAESVYYSQRKPSTNYFSGVTGKESSTTVYFYDWTKGYCKYKISKLPKGIKAEKYGSYVVLTGKPKSTANGKKVTVTATDEFGKKVKQTVLFYVGSSSKVITYTEKENTTVLTGDDRMEYFSVHAVGGTGSYTYKMTTKSSTVSLDYGEFYISDKVSAGKHTVKYTVTDSKNHKASSSLKFVAQKPVKVTGTLKTADKKAISSISLDFYLQDNSNKYYSHYPRVVFNEKKAGNYTAYVAPNGVYNVTAYGNDAYKRVYNFKVAKKAKKLNLVMPLYAITLKASDKSSLTGVTWHNSNGSTLGYGTKLYLKKGSYKINGSANLKKYSASFSVKKSATVTVKAASDVAGTLTEDVEKNISITSSKTLYYTFKPSKTGVYSFTASNVVNDMNVYLYTSASFDNTVFSGYIYSNYSRQMTLTAGQTYYLRISPEDYSTASATIKFSPLQVDDITAGSNVDVSVGAGQTKYYKFVPATSGYYKIQASNVSGYSTITVYDSGFYYETSESGSSSYSCYPYMSAGSVYYVAVGADSDASASLSMNITLDNNYDYDY